MPIAQGPTRVFRVLVVGVALATWALATGCQDERSTAPASAGEAAPRPSDDELPPLPIVKEGAAQLLFSYVDVHGRIQATGDIGSVPEDVRRRVLVVDLGKTPEERQAHRYAFFVDLTARSDDGTYPVSVVSRYDPAKGEAAPTLLETVPPGTVVVYSAVWCGFCKKAKAWLAENEVPFVERDVEKMPGAQAELQKKLRAAGLAGGGVPVLDWDGELIMGFDKPRLEKLLAKGAK